MLLALSVAFFFVYSLSKAKAGGPASSCCQGKAGPGVQGVQGEAASSRAEEESRAVLTDLKKPCARGGARESWGESSQRRGEFTEVHSQWGP